MPLGGELVDLTLRAVSRTCGPNVDLKTGAASASGIRLDFEEVPVLVGAFRRMVRELAWDVSEMAFTTYLCARDHGAPLTALPVFLVRGLHHASIVRHREARLRDPREIEGRQVAVGRGWTVTTGVWARGVLADEWQVDLDRVTWLRTGDEHVPSWQPPPNVASIAAEEVAGGIRTGDLAAAVNVPGLEDVVPLIPGAQDAGWRALAERGHYPINHLIVIRDDVLARQPDVGARLFEAFLRAKQAYVDRLEGSGDAGPVPSEDAMYRRVRAVTGGDPLPYGVEPNRSMIEHLLDHAMSQHVLRVRPAVDELFAPGTVALGE